MTRFKSNAVAILIIAIAGCGGGDPRAAAVLCGDAAREYAGTVVASMTTTVGAIRGLDPSRAEPAPWPQFAATQPAALCYIDAEIAKGPPPVPGAASRNPTTAWLLGSPAAVGS